MAGQRRAWIWRYVDKWGVDDLRAPVGWYLSYINDDGDVPLPLCDLAPLATAERPACDLTLARAVLTTWAAPVGDLTPTEADLRAHVILTAAPPASRAPVPAGAAA